MLLCKKLAAFAAVGLIFGLGLVTASPGAKAYETIPLTVYNPDWGATDFEAELRIDTYMDGGTWYASLTFVNLSEEGSSAFQSAIDKIWLEEGFGNIFDGVASTSSTGVVNITQETVNSGTKPNNSTEIGWTTTWADGYWTRDGNKDDGINALGYNDPGEDDSFTLILAFGEGEEMTAEDLKNSILTDEDLRLVAIHSNACVDNPDQSCNAVATPIPGAIWLLGSAILGLVGFGARRKVGTG